MRFRSAFEPQGMVWPAILAPRTSQVVGLLRQLEESQWWTPDVLLDAQRAQGEALLAYARDGVPFYADRLPAALPALGTGAWRELPLLVRADILNGNKALRPTVELTTHGPLNEVRTSGSTGQPVAVMRTGFTGMLSDAITLRDHLWHRRDQSLTCAGIRADHGSDAPDGRGPGWGGIYDALWTCGDHFNRDLSVPVTEQVEWLKRIRPDYLITYPTNLTALLELMADADPPFRLKQMICLGETVTDALRRRCREVFDTDLVANYSSRELGYLALQCPDCGQQHVQAESLFVEVLDEAGRPCGPGQVGRIVVTDLHNFAMPLIRYEIGDYAEVGVPCSAGRGLPSLARILGRRRNMIMRPDGGRHWPTFGFATWDRVARVRQFQFIQHAPDEIEARLSVDEPLTQAQREGLTAIIQEAVGYPFRVVFTEVSGPLKKNVGGKFEEFICLL